MPGNPGAAQAELSPCERCLDEPVHASRGVPGFIRSDNGPEFVAQAVRDWITAVGAKTTFFELGSPWENALRKLQRSHARLTPERRDLLFAPRRPDRHRRLAAPLQNGPGAHRPRLPTAGIRGDHLNGPETSDPLTIHLDQSLWAAHCSLRSLQNASAVGSGILKSCCLAARTDVLHMPCPRGHMRSPRCDGPPTDLPPGRGAVCRHQHLCSADLGREVRFRPVLVSSSADPTKVGGLRSLQRRRSNFLAAAPR